MKAANPGISFGDVGKKLGELWRNAAPDEKAPFEAQAAEAKVGFFLICNNGFCKSARRCTVPVPLKIAEVSAMLA